MKVLLTASECSPFIKIGGMADVIGSLPLAISQFGVDIRIVIPFYRPLHKKFDDQKDLVLDEVAQVTVPFAGKDNRTTVYQTTIPGTQILVYMIDNETYISNGGIYFSPEGITSPEDELNRFAFFSRAISDTFTYPDSIFQPDIIHANDWHTGMVAQIAQSTHRYGQIGLPKTIFTIHNLAYQGFSKLEVADKLGLSIKSDQSLRWDAQDDNLDFLLQGIVNSNYITTVSERYAKEIQTPEFGEGLDEILKARKDRLIGIINGLSYEIFNPLTDSMIYTNYSVSNYIDAKAKNKAELQKDIGLDVNPAKPLVGVVSRLALQKGLDLVSKSIKTIVDMGYQFVLLGTGDPQLEASFNELNGRFYNNYKAKIMFSEDLARKIYAGSDMFLVPSRYEPSGLTQMIAMKYGSVPVVRATGGLFDTVPDGEVGYTFEDFTKESMLEALRRAFIVYSSNKTEWNKLVTNGMNKDYGWKQSARKYVMLYKKALAL